MASLPTRGRYNPRASLDNVDSTISMQVRMSRASSVPRNVSYIKEDSDPHKLRASPVPRNVSYIEDDSDPYELSSRKRAVSNIDNIWLFESSEVDEEEAKQRRSSRDKARGSSSDIWDEAERIQIGATPTNCPPLFPRPHILRYLV